MFVHSKHRVKGQQPPRESSFHGESRRRANTFLPPACVVSPNIPLAEASHVAKFKFKGRRGKLCFFVNCNSYMTMDIVTRRVEELG